MSDPEPLTPPASKFARIAPLVIPCALPWLIFTLVVFAGSMHELPGARSFGYLRGDLPAYTVFARATYLRGNGFFYATPFDSDPASPRVLLNLAYSALGLLIRVTGERPVIAWEIWRALFGTLYFGLFAAIASRIVGGVARRWCLALGLFGGGIGWAFALWLLASGTSPTLAKALERAEDGYGWWALNVFRQGIYPLELGYHTLLLGGLWLYLSRRYAALVAVIALAWSCHAIPAALLTTIAGTAMVLDLAAKRFAGAAKGESAPTAGDSRAIVRSLSAIAGISLFAAWYYLRFIPGFPVLRSWVEQTASLSASMSAVFYLRAYGPLIAAPLLIAWRPLREWLFGCREGRLILVWLLAVLAWTHHEHFLPSSLQPIHFMRGHLYAALAIFLGKALELYLHGRGITTITTRLRAMLTALLLVLIADNAFFVWRVASDTSPSFVTKDALEVIRFYHDRPDPPVCFYWGDRGLAVSVMMTSPHRALMSETFLTPNFIALASRFTAFNRAGDVAGLKSLGLEELILNRDGPPRPAAWQSDRDQSSILFENGTYVVLRLLP